MREAVGIRERAQIARSLPGERRDERILELCGPVGIPIAAVLMILREARATSRQAGRRQAAQLLDRGPDEQLKTDERADRVPGESEYERVVARATRLMTKPQRLAGLQIDLVKHLRHAQLR